MYSFADWASEVPEIVFLSVHDIPCLGLHYSWQSSTQHLRQHALATLKRCIPERVDLNRKQLCWFEKSDLPTVNHNGFVGGIWSHPLLEVYQPPWGVRNILVWPWGEVEVDEVLVRAPVLWIYTSSRTCVSSRNRDIIIIHERVNWLDVYAK